MKYEPDEAVGILVAEGYRREDADVVIGQLADENGLDEDGCWYVTDGDLELAREQLEAPED